MREVAVEIVDADAIEIGDLYTKAKRGTVEAVETLRQCGMRLAVKKGTMSHGEWLPWLAANAGVLGFESRRTATRLMQLASNGTLASHLDAGQAVAISRQIWGHSNTTATKWTGDPESYTPSQYIESARRVMGSIDLDPASNELAQKTVNATTWFGEEDDGLSKDWAGNVFLNPPYKYPLVEDFIQKLCDSSVRAAILLTNNNTDTRWWHLAASRAKAICFTLGRINFYKADGSETQPTNGQTFFYFGSDVDLFRSEFEDYGSIL